VWTLNLLLGLGCAAVTALAAYPAAQFYSDARLVPVMMVLALGWAGGSLTNVGIVDFRRHLDFAKEFRFLIATRVVTFSITIPLAVIFQTYWALVAGITVGRVANVVFSYLWHPYRPRLCLQASRELFSFSLWIFVEKIASFGNARAADFVLGRTQGPAAVGVYRLGEEIGYLPGSELVAPINRVLLPGASRLVEAGSSIGHVATTSAGIVAVVLLPACFGIAAVADPLVRVMLGEQWLAAIPIVEIMALNAAVVALWGNQHTALLAGGLPKLPGVIAVARFAVFAPCVLWLTPDYAALGVAVSALVSSTFAFLLGLKLSLRRLSMALNQYVGAVWRPLAASLTMFAAIRVVTSAVDPLGSTIGEGIELGASVGMGAGVYLLALGLLFLLAGRPRGAEQLVVDYVGRAFRR
jgi:O-antigen/teichoic acid export membrane protein